MHARLISIVALLCFLNSADALRSATALLQIRMSMGEDRRLLYVSWSALPPGDDVQADAVRLTALDLTTGEPAWHLHRGDHPAFANWDYTVRQWLIGDILILRIGGQDGFNTVALDTSQRGRLVWQSEDIDPYFRIGRVLLSSNGQAWNPATGESLWSIESWNLPGRAAGMHSQFDVDAETGELAIVRLSADTPEILRFTIHDLGSGEVLREHETGIDPDHSFHGIHHQQERTVLRMFQDGRTVLHVFDDLTPAGRQYAANHRWLSGIYAPYPWLFWERGTSGIVGWLDVRNGERHETERIDSMVPDPTSEGAMLFSYLSQPALHRLDPVTGVSEVVAAEIEGPRQFYGAHSIKGSKRVAFDSFFSLTCVDLASGQTLWTTRARQGARPVLWWYNEKLGGALFEHGVVDLFDPETGEWLRTVEIEAP